MISFWWALRSWTQFSFALVHTFNVKSLLQEGSKLMAIISFVCLTLEQLDGPELSNHVYMVLLVSGAGGKTLLILSVYIQGHGWLKVIVIRSTCPNVTCYMTSIVTHGFAVEFYPILMCKTLFKLKIQDCHKNVTVTSYMTGIVTNGFMVEFYLILKCNTLF